MRATIETHGASATIEGWEWRSENEIVSEMLNQMLPPDGPSGADPAPNYHAALDAVEQFGGHLVSYELPEYVEGRIY